MADAITSGLTAPMLNAAKTAFGTQYNVYLYDTNTNIVESSVESATWGSPISNTISLTASIVFTVSAGSTVNGVVITDAGTNSTTPGTTIMAAIDLSTPATFSSNGTYTLTSLSISVNV